MTNPFDKKIDKEKHEFFNGMTTAINDWMLKQYPEFDQSLIRKIGELERLQKEISSNFSNHENFIKKQNESLKNLTISQIDNFLKEKYPDVSHSMVDLNRKMQDTIQQHEKNCKMIKEKLEKVIKSDAIYEDVYLIRDEMKELKKSVEEFTNKMKKVFK